MQATFYSTCSPILDSTLALRRNMQYVLYRRYRISPSLFTTSQWSKCKDRRDGEEKVAWGFFFFIALNITDLKLYFFLGETMKHEKERERER